jgi:hypothetical protein
VISKPDKQILSGQGWRLGWLPNADVFVGLLSGDRWSIELTESELKDFCSLGLRLAEAMNEMQAELSDQEKLTCDGETENLYIEATGYPDQFSFYLQLKTGRRFEGSWSEDVVPELLEAIAMILPAL